jgi:hypothetical protein
MSKHLWIAFIVMLGVRQSARALEALEIPLHPTEARIVAQIISVEGHPVEVAEVPGWAKGGVVNQLKEEGVEVARLKTWGVRDTKKNAVSFNCVYDENGRVLALFGNGPWLRDESLRALKGMPELRIIRFDHNGYLRQHPLSPLYSGKGFDELADSKLIDIKLTLGINDAGMEQAAKIKGLKSVSVVHSQVSEAGVKFFEGHPSLEFFSIAEMGNVSQAALASIAKMPKVEHVGFHEAFVTYDGGLKHLLPMKGRLKTLDLSMSLVNADDLELVRADHPDAKITTITPAEIVKRHSYVAARIARTATGPAADELKKAIAEFEANKKPSK